MEIIIAIISSTGILSIVFAAGFKSILKHINDDKKRREMAQGLLIDLSLASIDLGEANALALQRGKANGECDAALQRAREVREEHQKFLKGIAIQRIY